MAYAGQPWVVGHGVEDDEPGGRPLSHGDGDGAVGLHHRGRLVADELCVEEGDLCPIGGRTRRRG